MNNYNTLNIKVRLIHNIPVKHEKLGKLCYSHKLIDSIHLEATFSLMSHYSLEKVFILTVSN